MKKLLSHWVTSYVALWAIVGRVIFYLVGMPYNGMQYGYYVGGHQVHNLLHGEEESEGESDPSETVIDDAQVN